MDILLDPNANKEELSTGEELLQFLTFSVGKDMYGLELLSVHEILKPVPITRIPNVEESILGVINLRGEIIPIIDLRKKFDLGYTELVHNSRFIVIMHEEKRVGLFVDEVKGVIKIYRSDLSTTSSELSLNYNNLAESVSRYNGNLILNLSIEHLANFTD